MPLHAFFFYATLILLPSQLGIHLWPDWALVLGRRVDYLSPTLYLTDITIILTLITWLFILIFKSQFSIFKQITKIKLQTSKWIIIIPIILIVLNITLASSPNVALYRWVKVAEFFLFGLYIVKTKPSVSRSLWCLCFAVFYSSIIAIAQYWFQHSVGGLLWFLGERTFDVSTPGIARISMQSSSFSYQTKEAMRAYGTFPHPNVLGGFLAIVLPISILQSTNLLIYQSTNKLKKISLIIAFIFGSVALFLTFSRSAWVAFGMGMAAIIFYNLNNCYKNYKNYNKPKIPEILGLPMLLVGLAIVAFPYFQSISRDSESVFVRKELAAAGLTMWQTSPIIGVGLGNFLTRLPNYYPHKEIFFLQPVHNIYLLMVAETGIAGILIFGIGIAYLFYGKLMKFNGNLYFFISLSLYLLLGMVDHYPLTVQQGMLFLTVLISFVLI